MGHKTRLILIILGLALVIGFAASQFLLKDKNSKTNSLTGKLTEETVSRGDVVLTVETSGVVESDNDILLRSPERSIVKEVLVNAGSKVKKGDLLITLEEKGIRQELDRMSNQLEVKQNTLEKYQLNQENIRLSMTQSEEMKRKRIETLKTSLTQLEEALKTGSVDASRAERTRNEIEIAEADLQNLVEKNEIRLKQLETDRNSLQLQISSQEQELAQKRRLLNDLQITSPTEGVIQEVSVQNGERVDSEQLLVKMSDFSSFKVVGWANVLLSDLIKTGDSANVTIDGKTLKGTVGEISQMYTDEMIRFDVYLDHKQDPALEVNKSVAVEVISSKRENVVRIKRQDSIQNTKQQTVYVVHGKEGVKTNVILGVVGNEWCEVVSGLNEGDVIVTSDLNQADDPQTIDVR